MLIRLIKRRMLLILKRVGTQIRDSNTTMYDKQYDNSLGLAVRKNRNVMTTLGYCISHFPNGSLPATHFLRSS